PREIEAKWFTTVTTSGLAIVCVFPISLNAWSARLMLKLLPTRPKANPAVGIALAALARAPIGKFTTLAPVGRPVVGEIGSKLFATPIRLGLVGEKLDGGMPPPVFGCPKPCPTKVALPVFAAPPPPHWTPIASSALLSRISIRASILTCGKGTSRESRMSAFKRSRSAPKRRRNRLFVGQCVRIVSLLATTSADTGTWIGASCCRGGPNSCENGGSAIGPLVAPPPVPTSTLVSIP